MAKVYIALGSNRGNRQKYIADALRHIQKHVFIEKVSPFIFSLPAENAKGGKFLNGVIEGKTTLSPQRLISFLHHAEAETGRSFPHAKGDEREIDLDIIFYGERVIKRADLVIPHPRYSRRNFVLIPMVEIAPFFRDPKTGKKMVDVKIMRKDGNENRKNSI